MDRSDLASRRRSTFDIPAKPETGLAEWTSKIKALQRQVDEDEEAETKRLEQEIAASRLARMRRSTGRGASTDLSKTDVAEALRETASRTTAEPETIHDRQKNQDDSLRKLIGESSLQNAAERGVPTSGAKANSLPAPVSLAAFMGGRATGPRLNRHAPQQDAHDPTQFNQKPVAGPHPVFGKGGIAMPGMTGKGRVGDREERPPPEPTSTPVFSREYRVSTPSRGTPMAKSPIDKAEEQRNVAPQRTGGFGQEDLPRQRAISTPSGAAPMKSFSTPRSPPIQESRRGEYSPQPVSRSQTPRNPEPARSTTPKASFTTTNNVTHALPPRANSISPMPNLPAKPSFPSSATTSAPKLPMGSPLPGLAKPIQLNSRKSFQGPQVPLSPNPSHAFLKPPAAKDPTPSISRLQGRGFVQNMVKVSSQLELGSSTPSSPTAATTSEKAGQSARKSTVLDRWQHSNGGSPPIIAPKPVPMRKSRTMDPSDKPSPSESPVRVFPTFTPPPAGASKSDNMQRTLKSRASFPSIARTQESPPKGVDASPLQKRPLGSSTTMVSYIKPLKTGDGSTPNTPPSRPASAAASRSRPATPEVDELGIRVRSSTRSIGGVTEGVPERTSGSPGGGASSKPLSHPTKDRARKPRKDKSASAQSPKRHLAVNNADRHASDSTNGSSGPNIPKVSVVRRAVPSSPSPPSTTFQKLESPVIALPTPRGSSPSDSPPPTPGASRRVHFPLVIPAVPPPQLAEKSPATPIRHSRIPSTGNRATVMDVAQALSEHEQRTSPSEDPAPQSMALPPRTIPSSPDILDDADKDSPAEIDVVSSWGLQAPAIERRKSSYEKYSAFVLPPLAEENTPVQSPVGTLKRNVVPPAPDLLEELGSANNAPGMVASASILVNAPSEVELQPEVDSRVIHFEHDDQPLPVVDVQPLINAAQLVYTPDSDVNTVSVDVMAIVGTTASAITIDPNIFYDSELLAIIHRSKAKSSGLVATKVWAWQGIKSKLGESEERKLQELARRYNTSLIVTKQFGEPSELVYTLGGQLAIRQGIRAHWSSENTAMHLVRAFGGVTYIDELDLSIKNLCSGFSYCISLLQTFYVWHGRGATDVERHAALKYAQSLAPSASDIIELIEGESDEDEMFWLILGEGEYAKADYWRWKATSDHWQARIWMVNGDQADSVLLPLASISNAISPHSHIFILDCVWEYFVLVGSEARGKRKDIRIALNVASETATKIASSRPYSPTVHVLILPSQLPADLRLAFRDFDETQLNQGLTPDHLNLLPVSLAKDHLQQTLWQRDLLTDSTILPLGLDVPQ